MGRCPKCRAYVRVTRGGGGVPSLFAHSVPVYPCTLAASSSLAWPLLPIRGLLSSTFQLNLSTFCPMCWGALLVSVTKRLRLSEDVDECEPLVPISAQPDCLLTVHPALGDGGTGGVRAGAYTRPPLCST